jgi:DNA-binding FadR family transcriptional regulator
MGCVEYVDGVPLTGDHEAPADGDARRAASGAYRPRYELAAEQIRQLIGHLALQPGDRMPTEKELAIRLGTSRTVVRDAVKILSATGQVSVQKGRGLYVAGGEGILGASRWGGFFAPTNLDHIFMLFEFRRIQDLEFQTALFELRAY